MIDYKNGPKFLRDGLNNLSGGVQNLTVSALHEIAVVFRAEMANSRGLTRTRIILYLTAIISILCITFACLTQKSSHRTLAWEEGSDRYTSDVDSAFKGTIHISDLPSSALPQIGRHRGPGRLIVIGDVHGMIESLLHLLKKVKFDDKHDHLVFAGDMISKGPDSVGVVDLLIELGKEGKASAVRGNHEDTVLGVYKEMDIEEITEDGEALEMLEQRRQTGEAKNRLLVRALGKRRLKWLETLPVILRVGKLGNMGAVVVVHAGLAPGVPLTRQDPNLVMTMRTIKNGVPSEENEGQAWMKVWNKFQRSLSKRERSTVIFGHDSKRGLQEAKYSLGIDTGCLKGGQLTAAVIEGGLWRHKRKIVSVQCKDGRQ